MTKILTFDATKRTDPACLSRRLPSFAASPLSRSPSQQRHVRFADGARAARSVVSQAVAVGTVHRRANVNLAYCAGHHQQISLSEQTIQTLRKYRFCTPVINDNPTDAPIVSPLPTIEQNLLMCLTGLAVRVIPRPVRLGMAIVTGNDATRSPRDWGHDCRLSPAVKSPRWWTAL